MSKPLAKRNSALPLRLLLSGTLFLIYILGLPPNIAAMPNASPNQGRTIHKAEPNRLLNARVLAPATQQKLDPRLIIALSTPRFSHLALAQMTDGGSAKEVSELLFPVLIQSHLSDAELAELGLFFANRCGEIISARVPASLLLRLAANPSIEYIEAARPMNSTLDLSVPEIRADLVTSDPTGFTGAGVIIGIIDSGIDVTHRDFLTADDSTRVLSIWDQALTGTQPAGQSYGREFTQADINNGDAYLHIDRLGHGTHVTSIAAGNNLSDPLGTYQGVAPEAYIILVNNRFTDMVNYGGGTPPYLEATTVGAVDGLNYIIRRAEALGKPLVVNQSQGVAMGPHDGTTLFERAYSNLIEEHDLIICVAAGNWQSDSWHGRITVPREGQNHFNLLIEGEPNPPATFEFECWGKVSDRFKWEIRSPGGTNISVPSSLLEIDYQITSHNDTIWFWSTASHANNGESHLYCYGSNSTAGIEPDIWSITVIADNDLPGGGMVDLYCERDQSSLSVENPSSEYTLAMPGCVPGVITVGSYNTKLSWTDYNGNYQSIDNENPVGDISSFSSLGPCRDGRLKPDIAAPGQVVAAAWAMGCSPPLGPAGITPDGRHVLFRGTSMAAPHVAGTIALMLEVDPTLELNDVKGIIQATARSDRFTGVVPNTIFGAGKLDAKAAVDATKSGICLTQAGDTNGDDQVNVLDLVSTVNVILGISDNPEFGFVCGDIDEDNQITISDLVAIGRLSLGLDIDANKTDEPSPPVIWSQTEDEAEDAVFFTFRGENISALHLVFIPPIGYEIAGDPTLHGASQAAQIRYHSRLRQYHLVIYNPTGLAITQDKQATLVIPLANQGASNQAISDFAITRAEFSDQFGRHLSQAAIDTLSPHGIFPPEIPEPMRTRISPNPNKNHSRIDYELPASDTVTISIWDVAGRHIRTIFDGWQKAGKHTIVWDGYDQRNQPVPTGTYFLRLATFDGCHSSRIIVVR